MSALDAALANFSLTPRADAERSALQQRLTMKFLLPAGVLVRFLGELATGYTLLPAGEERAAAYRSLHFDTPELFFFHQHRRGLRRRLKVRIRHYDDRQLSYFEVKQRIHSLKTVKERRERPFGDNTLHPEDLALVNGHGGRGTALVPQVWTLFKRLSLVTLQGDERVTLDFDLRFSDGHREVPAPNGIVVEVKQPRLSRCTPVMAALQRGAFREAQFSKYCAAVVAMHPDIRHNRLRPQIRALEHLRHG